MVVCAVGARGIGVHGVIVARVGPSARAGIAHRHGIARIDLVIAITRSTRSEGVSKAPGVSVVHGGKVRRGAVCRKASGVGCRPVHGHVLSRDIRRGGARSSCRARRRIQGVVIVGEGIVHRQAGADVLACTVSGGETQVVTGYHAAHGGNHRRVGSIVNLGGSNGYRHLLGIDHKALRDVVRQRVVAAEARCALLGAKAHGHVIRARVL